MPKTLSEAWVENVEAYCEDNGVTEYVIADVVSWAKLNERWTPGPEAINKIGISECRRALRSATQLDPKGRSVRTNISASIDQKDLWSHVDDASQAFAVTYVRQQEKGVRSDVASLTDFVDSWNEFHLKNGHAPIQMQLKLDDRGADPKKQEAKL